LNRSVSSRPPPPFPLGTVSVRVFWPFARVLGNYEEELEVLREAGVSVASFVDPATRIPMSLGRILLATSLQKSGDPALGLHAGECIEIADFAPIDQMTRHCATLRDAILQASRYSKLMDEGVETDLLEVGSRATVRLLNSDPNRHPVVSEFQVSSTIKRLGFFIHRRLEPLEIHLRHEVATNVAEYERVFRAPVRLSSEHNAVVFSRATLDVRAAHPNPNLLPLFDEQAQRLMAQLTRDASFSQKIRKLLEQGLEDGKVGMADIAEQVKLSEATLRRRLLEERTTHKELLDQVRREQALTRVQARRSSLGEISFRLGFSSPSAFARAFRRWAGVSPVEYRARFKQQQ
jgi:AraC-like DNA-binding protein